MQLKRSETIEAHSESLACALVVVTLPLLPNPFSFLQGLLVGESYSIVLPKVSSQLRCPFGCSVTFLMLHSAQDVCVVPIAIGSGER